VTAVENLSLEVKPAASSVSWAERVGKSTTIGCLTGILDPTAGEIEILGQRFDADNVAIKRRIGVMPETLGLFDPSTPRVSGFRSAHVRLDEATTRKRVTELLDALELTEPGKHWRNTAPECASAWPSPRP